MAKTKVMRLLILHEVLEKISWDWMRIMVKKCKDVFFIPAFQQPHLKPVLVTYFKRNWKNLNQTLWLRLFFAEYDINLESNNAIPDGFLIYLVNPR